MKGLKIMLNDTITYAGIADGLVSVILTNKEGPLTLSIGGMEADNRTHHVWMNKEVRQGDRIGISCIQMDESQLSPSERRVYPLSDEELLKCYDRLKQELEDEGIL